MENQESIRALLEEIIANEKLLCDKMAELAVEEETKRRWLTMNSKSSRIAKKALDRLQQEPVNKFVKDCYELIPKTVDVSLLKRKLYFACDRLNVTEDRRVADEDFVEKIAKLLGCLPSYFVGGNEHIVKQLQIKLGQAPCPTCSGSKKIKCSTCGELPFGSGMAAYGKFCNTCEGKGEVTCPDCTESQEDADDPPQEVKDRWAEERAKVELLEEIIVAGTGKVISKKQALKVLKPESQEPACSYLMLCPDCEYRNSDKCKEPRAKSQEPCSNPHCEDGYIHKITGDNWEGECYRVRCPDCTESQEPDHTPVKVEPVSEFVKIRAIEIIERSKKTHEDWLSYFENNPDSMSKKEYENIGDIQHHRNCIKEYSEAIAEIIELCNRLEAKTNLLESMTYERDRWFDDTGTAEEKYQLEKDANAILIQAKENIANENETLRTDLRAETERADKWDGLYTKCNTGRIVATERADEAEGKNKEYKDALSNMCFCKKRICKRCTFVEELPDRCKNEQI